MNRLLSHLRIADLELFITAAHLRSLGKAAEYHHLSQSAASAAIIRVEAAFDRPLCLHEKRQFRLTPAGASLIPKAEAWLKQFREAVSIETPRTIRLVTTHAIARVAIPTLLASESLELTLMRPDLAYEAVLKDQADIALVLNNAPWDEVISVEVGNGAFQLYSTNPNIQLTPVILPENQLEVLNLMQKWEKIHQQPLPVKARIPSWSLIADICANSKEVGFLPEFLAKSNGLQPVKWQPKTFSYRILALHRPATDDFKTRLNKLIDQCRIIFNGE